MVEFLERVFANLGPDGADDVVGRRSRRCVDSMHSCFSVGVFRLLQDAPLAFLGLAIDKQLFHLFWTSFEGFDELLVEAFEVFVLC